MEKLKEIADKHSKWSGLAQQINRIEYQIASDLTAAIGSTKSLLESICKTILDLENIEYTNTDSINKLSKKTIQALGIENPAIVSQFGNSIVTAIHNLGEIRNIIDSSSHGKSLVKPQGSIDIITASFLIHSAESIACFLVNFYESKNINSREEEIKFEEMTDFNDYLDDEYGSVNIALIPYPTSEALFTLDKIAYKNEYQRYLDLENEEFN